MSAAAVSAVRPVLTPRRWAAWIGVAAGGAVTLALAAHALVLAPPNGSHARIGVALLLLAAAAGDRWPNPTRGNEAGMSAGPVALVSAAVLYGAPVAALIFAVAIAQASVGREHPLKVAFNTGMYALMGGAAGLAGHGHGGGVVGEVLLATGALIVVNIAAMALIIPTPLGEAANAVLAMSRDELLLPTALTVAIAPLFIIAWQTHPSVALVAVAPAVAMALLFRGAERERKATALSLTDPLTGLGNRRALANRLDRELERAAETGSPVSVCLLDMNGFKRVNDSRGHEGGDRALVAVADVLRRDGEAFRYGGDEFVLVLPGRDRSDAEEVGAAVRARVSALDETEGVLSISVGVATCPDHGVDCTDLLRVADSALYVAKS